VESDLNKSPIAQPFLYIAAGRDGLVAAQSHLNDSWAIALSFFAFIKNS
jgi:hypothetical protein